MNSYPPLKKSFLMLFCIIASALSACATTYYVSTSGADGSSVNGTTQPWLTVAYAATRVTTAGSVIHVYAGTYAESAIINLAPGVSLEGDNRSNTIITTNGTGGQKTVTKLLSLVSSTIIDGNQSISNLTFDGKDFTVTDGILVNCRNNVTIHDITVRRCCNKGLGVWGIGSSPVWPALADESTLISNLQIYNCSFLDSGAPIYLNGVPQAYSYPAVQIYQVKDSSIHHCVFDNTNYGGFNFCVRYLTRVKIYNCTMIQAAHWPNAGRNKGFGFEGVYIDRVSFYSNTTNGSVSSLSSNSTFDHNTIIMPPTEGSSSGFECSGYTNQYSYNYVEGTTPPFALWDSGTNQNFTFSNNVVRNSGAGAMNIGGGNLQSIYIYNNTFDGCSNPYQNGVIAIRIPNATATINDLRIRNNIISNPVNLHAVSLLTSSRSSQLTNTTITHNIFYGATGGEIYDQGSTGTVINNNTTSNPLFVGGTTYPAPYYRLQAGSPAKNTGINLGIQALSYPPDRGAFVQDTAIGTRYEAEMNYVTVSDVGTYGAIGIGGGTLCSYYKVNVYDPGDSVRLHFNAPADGTYTLYVRVRSGGSTGSTAYWPNGYSFLIDGFTPITLVGDVSTISDFETGGGGTYWGTMKGTVTLTKGNHNVQVTDLTSWGFLDYVELH